MQTEENKIDFWGDGMRIFLDYIGRQMKKNPEYNPHPLIRALELALYNIQNADVGQCVMGVSQDGTKDSVYNPFAVVMQKHEDGSFEVKEIRNLKVNKELPLDVMVIIFRIQILLDKIPGDVVSPDQMVDCLNKVIPGGHFYALGDRWKEARDSFKEAAQKGQISLPKSPEMEKVISELLQITYNTPWEDYSPGARSLIGSQIKPRIEEGAGTVIVTTPKHFKVEKYKVFDMATEFILGKSSEYLNLFKRPGSDKAEDKEKSKPKS